MIFLIIFLVIIIFIIAIYFYNNTKKSKETIYDEMVSVKGWVALILIIISILLYILQKAGIIN